MNTSVFLAQILGLLFILFGLGMIFNAKYYNKVMAAFRKDTGLLFVWGMLETIAGFAIVNAHNVWEKEWFVIITVIGWLALVEGSLILVFPDAMRKTYKSVTKNAAIASWGFLTLILGIALVYFGFLV